MSHQYVLATQGPSSDTGEADADVSVITGTNWNAILTIAPVAGNPLEDVHVTLSLDKTTTGFADVATTETVQFRVARKVDGSAWFGDEETKTTAIAGDNADGDAVSLEIGTIGPTEQARIEVIFSVEPGSDVEFPYVLYWKGVQPTITAAAAA